MKDWRKFLLSCKGWQDEKGNTVVFSDRGLIGEPNGDELWLFLDEGLRCGGMHRHIDPKKEAVKEALLGVGKTELWEAIERDWNEEE
ncbi:hypothetical protein [Anaerotignum sp.]|nr:hypothetical protein [Anaerotignum sp.]MBQ7757996.1 hypothetical protein [Anaerotignum sp.]